MFTKGMLTKLNTVSHSFQPVNAQYVYMFNFHIKNNKFSNTLLVLLKEYRCTVYYCSDRSHSTPQRLPNMCLTPEVESSVEIGTCQHGSYFGVIFSHATYPRPAGAK